MKYWKRILVLFLFAFTLLFPTEIKAQEKFDITNYDITMIVHEDGSIDIDEKIDMEFDQYAHGFYRNIPVRYDMNWGEMGNKTYYFPVSNIDVHGDLYDTNSSSEGVQVKIGDPDKYVIGPKSYHITYTVQMRDLMIDQDYFYYNLIGNGFDCTISNVHFKIEMPKSFDASKLDFTGSNVSYEINHNVIEGNINEPLTNYQGLTAYLPLGQDYFEFKPITDYSMMFMMLCGILFLLCIFLYLKYGRKEEPVVTVEFEAPKGISSAGVGYIIDGVVNNEDVISLIIDFANRGLLTIHDADNPDNMILTKISNIEENVPTYEKTFFNSIFNKNDSVSLIELKNRNFGDQIQIAKEQIYNYFHLNKNKVFCGSSLTVQILCCIFTGLSAGLLSFAAVYKTVGMVELAILPLIIIWPLLSASTIFWILLARQKHAYSQAKKFTFTMLAIVFHVITFTSSLIFTYSNLIAVSFSLLYTISMIYMIATSGKRTEIGNKWLGQILGLKEFIQEAEKEKLEMLVLDDPSYFYHILPYAYVLGISDTWSKKFEGININSPDWYVSSNPNFATIYWMSRFNSTMHSFNALPSAITPPKASSGGFSSGSGGFSGGGFGGGGGGSW